MLSSSPPNLEAMDDAIRRGLCDSGAAKVTASSVRLLEKSAVRTRISVSDMVPPFQQWTLTIEEWLARDPRAFMQPVADLAKFVHTEREVRQWSYVDP